MSKATSRASPHGTSTHCRCTSAAKAPVGHSLTAPDRIGLLTTRESLSARVFRCPDTGSRQTTKPAPTPDRALYRMGTRTRSPQKRGAHPALGASIPTRSTPYNMPRSPESLLHIVQINIMTRPHRSFSSILIDRSDNISISNLQRFYPRCSASKARSAARGSSPSSS